MSTPTDVPQRYGPATSGFACFGCWAGVPAQAERCPHCGTEFVGAEPARLWRLEGELSRLDGERAEVAAEAGRLRSSLMKGASSRRVTPPVTSSGLPSFPRPVPAQPSRGARASVEWGGQQLLLALGGFLLLSGAAFFLYVAWDLIGLLGQAAVMVTLTLAAAFAARSATVHRLPAAAETAALIATGLLALDVAAAYSLGLFGVDEADPNLYFGLVGLLAAGVLIGFDLMVPARGPDVDGGGGRESLRPIQSYRPIAAFVAAASAWNLLGLIDVIGGDRPGAAVLSALLLVIGGAGVSVALVAQKYDRVREGSALRASVIAALVAAVPALLGHVLFAMAEGYGPHGADRLSAFALLLAMPVALLVAVALGGRSAARAGWVRGAVVGACLGLLLAVGVWLWVTPREVLLVIAVGAALALVALAVLLFVRPEWGDASAPRGEAFEIASWVTGGVAVALNAMVLVLDLAGSGTMAELMELSLASDAGSLAPMVWWAPALPLLGVGAYFVLSAVRLRSDARGAAGWVLAGYLSSGAGLATALRDVAEQDWRLPLLLFGVLAAGLAGLRAWNVADARGEDRARVGATMTERLHLTASVLLMGASVLVSTSVSASTVLVFALVAAVTHLAVATAPGRVEAGWWVVLWVSIAVAANGVERGHETVEAFTMVPALALVVLGVARWMRGRTRSSWGVLGCALTVGMVPSLMTMVVVHDATRTALMTVAALGLLLGGCAARWGAPVVFGTLGLLAVGWLQGDVWFEYVPTWLTLTLAGSTLLVVGVGWERAVALGRRSSDWLASLR